MKGIDTSYWLSGASDEVRQKLGLSSPIPLRSNMNKLRLTEEQVWELVKHLPARNEIKNPYYDSLFPNFTQKTEGSRCRYEGFEKARALYEEEWNRNLAEVIPVVQEAERERTVKWGNEYCQEHPSPLFGMTGIKRRKCSGCWKAFEGQVSNPLRQALKGEKK